MKYLMILIVVFITNCASRAPVVEFYKPASVVCDSRVESAVDAYSKKERKYTRPTFEVWIKTLECIYLHRSRLEPVHSDES